MSKKKTGTFTATEISHCHIRLSVPGLSGPWGVRRACIEPIGPSHPRKYPEASGTGRLVQFEGY